jgi:nucleoside-diphosphate-sugar epimerase
MHIAIFGATSQIARDLIASFAKDDKHSLAMFARRPHAVTVPQHLLATNRYSVFHLDEFNPAQQYDAIINFVGVGTPRKTVAMGSSILNITQRYDDIALDALRQNPHCRYLFLSSGAAYGSSFERPADERTPACFSINNLGASDWYGIAKFYAESRHRALVDRPIVDIRLFNYFSRTQDHESGFLISDVVNAIRGRQPLQTSQSPMIRDYIGPRDFHQLVERILAAPPINLAVDCYTRQAISKEELLSLMQQHFNLRYDYVSNQAVSATGGKPHYYSVSRIAESFGYAPVSSSADNILTEMRALLANC